MIAVRIASDLGRLEKAVGALQKRIGTEIARGLNEGGDKVRTQVRAAMREQTSLVRLNSVTRRQRTVRAYAEKPQYAIVFSGRPATKPDEFKTRVTTGPGGGVTIVMWGRPHKFKRSFQQKFKLGLRARLGAERTPVRGFDGPNLAKEALKDQVAETFMAQAAALVPPVIEKRLARLIAS